MKIMETFKITHLANKVAVIDINLTLYQHKKLLEKCFTLTDTNTKIVYIKSCTVNVK